MANPMEKYLADAVQQFVEGSIVKGTVIDVRQNEVLVDIGYKSEGLIPKYEFLDPESIVTPGIFVSHVVQVPRVATQGGGFKKEA